MRGHKSGLLTVPDYNNLTQCEALDDIKLNLVSSSSHNNSSMRTKSSSSSQRNSSIWTKSGSSSQSKQQHVEEQQQQQQSQAHTAAGDRASSVASGQPDTHSTTKGSSLQASCPDPFTHRPACTHFLPLGATCTHHTTTDRHRLWRLSGQ